MPRASAVQLTPLVAIASAYDAALPKSTVEVPAKLHDAPAVAQNTAVTVGVAEDTTSMFV